MPWPQQLSQCTSGAGAGGGTGTGVGRERGETGWGGGGDGAGQGGAGGWRSSSGKADRSMRSGPVSPREKVNKGR